MQTLGERLGVIIAHRTSREALPDRFREMVQAGQCASAVDRGGRLVAKGHAFPFGLEARCRDVTHVGKAPPLPEMTISGLTRGQVFGEDQSAKTLISPALPDVRPAPQAGCFVSGLQVLLSRNRLR